jgi:hypothetical protein
LTVFARAEEFIDIGGNCGEGCNSIRGSYLATSALEAPASLNLTHLRQFTVC